MATTTNYGWTTPDDTALVKDGASAIRTLGTSVDTTTKNLNPETTLGDISFRSSTSNVNTRLGIGTSGQFLSVVAGVPAWAALTDQTPLTTKGDLFTFSTLDARLGVGANGTLLTADSAEATGLKWAAATAAGANWSLLNSGGTALTGATTITVSGISGKDKIAIFIDAASASASSVMSIRFNGDTGSNYNFFGVGNTYRSTYDSFIFRTKSSFSTDAIELGELSTNASSNLSGYMLVTGGNASGNKVFNAQAGVSPGGGNSNQGNNVGGFWNNSATITSVSIVSGTGNFDNGSIYIYTSA
jgi:hypothetical protein